MQQERHCTIGDIQHLGRAWVLPHPERTSPGIAPMVRDDEIEHAAVRLKKDYWLYAVFNCAATPEVHPIQDPARPGWQPIVTIEHYHLGAEVRLTAEDAEKRREMRQ